VSALPFVLAGTGARESVEAEIENLHSNEALSVARFWAGKWTGSTAKAACFERIRSAMGDPARVAEVVAALRPEQRAVLSIVKRYGGSVSGPLLGRELLARGLAREPKPEDRYSYRRDANPVNELCQKLVLAGRPEGYWSYGASRTYPSVSLPRHVASLVEPAAPLGWKPSAPAEKDPDSRIMRAPAEVLVDLEQTAKALGSMDGWKVNHGGALPAAVRNRLAKLLPAQPADPLEPPNRGELDYALLCALGVAETDEFEGGLVPGRFEALANLTPEAQASKYVRAWLTLRIWQDGVGAVPDRDNRDASTRIDPEALRRAREFLAWALARVAHSPPDWLDLETFLLDLYRAARTDDRSFYWHGYTWEPRLAAAAGKDERHGEQRSLAYWMDDEGIWAANALLSTFVHLGVVERGRSGGARSERWSFRLTEVGRAVFGAPEVRMAKAAADPRCLTLQPNHEILLYLDCADGPAVTTLGRIAKRDSATGVVQTFRLTRESVYAALEAGMTPGAIEAFLAERSRSGIPPNVAQSLAEWSRKREALVVRTGVALAAGLPAGQGALHGRAVGPSYRVVSSNAAGKGAKELGIAVEAAGAGPRWSVDEHGTVAAGNGLSLVGKARLRRFAEPVDGGWRVTADSVRAAKERGITAEQILAWLTAHLSHEVPAVLAIAVRNWWGGRGRAFLGGVVLLQVDDPAAFEALRRSERLRPLLKGTLGSAAFVVADDGRKEATKLLRDLGFSPDAECRLDPAGTAPATVYEATETARAGSPAPSGAGRGGTGSRPSRRSPTGRGR